MDETRRLLFHKLLKFAISSLVKFIYFSIFVTHGFIRYFFKSARRYCVKVKCRFHFASSNHDLLHQHERWVNSTRGTRK